MHAGALCNKVPKCSAHLDASAVSASPSKRPASTAGSPSCAPAPCCRARSRSTTGRHRGATPHSTLPTDAPGTGDGTGLSSLTTRGSGREVGVSGQQGALPPGVREMEREATWWFTPPLQRTQQRNRDTESVGASGGWSAHQSWLQNSPCSSCNAHPSLYHTVKPIHEACKENKDKAMQK